ncbi:sensor domain-containing diguanylate cyclase [Marinobacterium lutimaris]|uniref:diguanylate cyclase n=1 Tax=Marinobacterium lutimaris TaxID=568106 RepID=A0A1H6B1G6_9GAMM|nr:diguanylate cyclase [Marinobacterium lutimaris]SEG54701.1 PAS domain S-box-containing protein/diguanylate cyclase (GGDEF) domain-containing protein [Marinobacterium lutimaris]
MNTASRNAEQICSYCGASALQIQQWDDKTHFLGCSGCGARGPRTPISDEPLLHAEGTSLLRTVIDESPDIIILKNWEGNFLLCNDTLAKLYNSTPDEMVGKSDADFNPNREQVDFYLKNVQSVMRSGETQVVYEHSTDSITGDERYYQSIKKPLKGPDGSDRILVIAHDITELTKAHQVIKEKEKRYSYAMDAADVGIWDWDIPNNRVTHNAKWCELLGLDDQMSEHHMDVLSGLLHPEDRDDVMAAIQEALDGNGHYSHEHRMLIGGGEAIWVYDRGRVMEYDADGKPSRMVGSISDISMRKEFEQRLEQTSREVEKANEDLELLVAERTAALEIANQELKRVASRDPLTGVGNRMLFAEWLTLQKPATPLEVLMIDIDHFKQVNDRFGHERGDQVLLGVARCLEENVRASDLIVRWGGEEFLLLLSAVSPERALAIAESLRLKVEKLSLLPSGEPITLSIGVASGNAANIYTTICGADEALYQAKREGRNRTVMLPRPNAAPEASIDEA